MADQLASQTLETDAAALRESEDRYRALFNAIDEGFCLGEMIFGPGDKPLDYRFLQINPHFCEMTGISPDAVGRTARDLVPGLEDWWIDTYGRVVLTGESARFEHGSEAMGRYFDVFAAPFGARATAQFAIVFKDVSERKRVENALRESEERARLAIDAAQLGTWTYDAETGLIHIDARMREIFGEPRESVPAADLARRIDAEVRDFIATGIAAALEGSGPGIHEMEAQITMPDGAERWIAANGQALSHWADGQRKATRFVGTVIDITARRESEMELRRAVAAKDEFLGLVSHELRTPITTVLGNAEILMRTNLAVSDEERAESLRDIHDSAQRLNAIINDLLTLARAERGKLEPEPIELARVVTAFVAACKRDRQVDIEVTGGATRAIVVGEAGALTQVLGNFLTNAEKYGNGLPIEVTVRAENGEGRVCVLDRGIGIKPDEADHLFEAFFRSREAAPVSSGLGIGLSVCKTLAEAIGGHVWAAPREGGGSEFGIALPLYDTTST